MPTGTVDLPTTTAPGAGAARGIHSRIDIGDVGGELAGLLRGAHAHEVHARLGGIGDVGGEVEAALVLGFEQQVGEAGFEERGPALAQGADLGLVDIDADDLMAQRRHRGRVHGSQVPTTDDRNLHPHTPVRTEQFHAHYMSPACTISGGGNSTLGFVKRFLDFLTNSTAAVALAAIVVVGLVLFLIPPLHPFAWVIGIVVCLGAAAALLIFHGEWRRAQTQIDGPRQSLSTERGRLDAVGLTPVDEEVAQIPDETRARRILTLLPDEGGLVQSLRLDATFGTLAVDELAPCTPSARSSRSRASTIPARTPRSRTSTAPPRRCRSGSTRRRGRSATTTRSARSAPATPARAAGASTPRPAAAARASATASSPPAGSSSRPRSNSASSPEPKADAQRPRPDGRGLVRSPSLSAGSTSRRSG